MNRDRYKVGDEELISYAQKNKLHYNINLLSICYQSDFVFEMEKYCNKKDRIIDIENSKG